MDHMSRQDILCTPEGPRIASVHDVVSIISARHPLSHQCRLACRCAARADAHQVTGSLVAL
jgi:hypothetical protein